MGKKYYAVKKGRKTGVYATWDECRQQVESFPGAIYKSFTDYDMASQFLKGETSQKGEQSKDLEDKCNAYAYIDGSYDDGKKVYGSAVLLFYKGEKTVYKFSDNKPELLKLRNVAGEIEAAKYVMQYAYKNGMKQIKLYYDYAGIEMWAKKSWKANLDYTREYVEFYDKIKKQVEVIFCKVKAHAGDKYNEEVDFLAKSAVADFTNHAKEYNFELLKGNKTSATINIYADGKWITPDMLLQAVKKRWKLLNRAVKDIREMKAVYDVRENNVIVQVQTEKDIQIITIDGDEIYG